EGGQTEATCLPRAPSRSSRARSPSEMTAARTDAESRSAQANSRCSPPRGSPSHRLGDPGGEDPAEFSAGGLPPAGPEIAEPARRAEQYAAPGGRMTGEELPERRRRGPFLPPPLADPGLAGVRSPGIARRADDDGPEPAGEDP